MMQFLSSLKVRIFNTTTGSEELEQNSTLLACLANLH